MAEMFERHLNDICHALSHEQSNVRTARFNKKIQEVKTMGRGYENSIISDLRPFFVAVTWSSIHNNRSTSF